MIEYVFQADTRPAGVLGRYSWQSPPVFLYIKSIFPALRWLNVDLVQVRRARAPDPINAIAMVVDVSIFLQLDFCTA